jgi:hypothetical protein
LHDDLGTLCPFHSFRIDVSYYRLACIWTDTHSIFKADLNMGIKQVHVKG